MPHHQFRMLLILGLLLSGLSVARAASYTFTTLDVPGALHTQAWGINDRGHIAGLYVDNSANQDNHGFLYDGSRFTPLNVPFPGTILTRALGISNPGHIVGVYEAHGFEEGHGFLYIDGVFTSLDVPFSNANFTVAQGINSHSQIVGTYTSNSLRHGFLYDGSRFTMLDVPGVNQTLPFSINDRGQIVGGYQDHSFITHGFLYADGVFTTLDVPFPGTILTIAFGINDKGQIVGEYNDSTDIPHGFLYADGIFTRLDVPFPDALFTSAAIGINAQGQIVGYYNDDSGRKSRLHCHPQGKIPVAILTTDTLDATTVNAATVRFAAAGTEATPLRFSLEDVNRDGRPDLLLQSRTRDTHIACGNTSASLTGQTFSGQEIEGTDAIITVGCK